MPNDTQFLDFQSGVFQLGTYFQHTLILFHIWCRQNDMVLHTGKTKMLLVLSITYKQKRLLLHNPVISLKYIVIHMIMKTTDKILGVHVDDYLMLNNLLVN